MVLGIYMKKEHSHVHQLVPENKSILNFFTYDMSPVKLNISANI